MSLWVSKQTQIQYQSAEILWIFFVYNFGIQIVEILFQRIKIVVVVVWLSVHLYVSEVDWLLGWLLCGLAVWLVGWLREWKMAFSAADLADGFLDPWEGGSRREPLCRERPKWGDIISDI